MKWKSVVRAFYGVVEKFYGVEKLERVKRFEVVMK